MISPGGRERLREDWTRLLGSYGVPAGAAGPAFDRLAAAYSEPHRHYHTLDHLAEMFAILDRLADPEADSRAVRLAVWYHDVVYDTHAADNEARSADLAVRELTVLGLPADVVEEVRELVLATDHRHPSGALDWKRSALLDADLAVLGAAVDRYREYTSGIRREYEWVPEETYRAKRAEVLRHFLERPRIYLTPLLRQEREATARRNLAMELAELTRGS